MLCLRIQECLSEGGFEEELWVGPHLLVAIGEVSHSGGRWDGAVLKLRPQVEGKSTTESGQGLQPSPPASASLCLPVLSILSSPDPPNAHINITCTRMHSHSHACTYAQTCTHTHTHVHMYNLTISPAEPLLFGAHGFSISDIIPNLCCL